MFEHNLCHVHHCVWYMGHTMIGVANLGAMDDRDLAVVGYYRNDDVGIYGTFGWIYFICYLKYLYPF